MDANERPIAIHREHVHCTTVRFRAQAASPDDSVVIILALLVGAISGYLLALP